MKKLFLFHLFAISAFATTCLKGDPTTHVVEIVEKIPAELWIFKPQKAILAYTLEQYRGIDYPPPLTFSILRKFINYENLCPEEHESHHLLQSRLNECSILIEQAIQNLIAAKGPLELQKLWESTPFIDGYTLKIDKLDLTNNSSSTLEIAFEASANPPEYSTIIDNYISQLSSSSTHARFYLNQIHILTKAIMTAVKNTEIGVIEVFQTMVYPKLPQTIQHILDESIMLKITSYCAKRPNQTVLHNLSRLVFFTKLDLSYNKLTQSHCYFKNLNKLEELILHHNDTASISLINNFLINIPNIKFLDLSSCNLADIPPKVKTLSLIESLNLSNNPQLNSADILAIFIYIPWVKKVNFSHCELSNFPRSLEKKQKIKEKKQLKLPVTEKDDPLVSLALEELILAYNPALDVEDLDGVCKLFPNIKIVDLSYCDLTLDVFPEVTGLQNLEELSLEGNINLNPLVLDTPYYNWLPSLKRVNLNNTNLKNLFSTFRQDAPLEDLNLRENPELNLSTVANVATHLTNLKKLDLSLCNAQVIPDGIGSLETLENLEIEFNENVDKPSLKNALRKFKKLKKINMAVCQLEEQPEELQEMPNLEEIKIFGNSSFDANSIGIDETNAPVNVVDLRYCNIATNHPKVKQLRKKGIKVLI